MARTARTGPRPRGRGRGGGRGPERSSRGFRIPREGLLGYPPAGAEARGRGRSQEITGNFADGVPTLGGRDGRAEGVLRRLDGQARLGEGEAAGSSFRQTMATGFASFLLA